jgi:DNA primase
MDMSTKAMKTMNLDNNRYEFKQNVERLKLSVDPKHLLNSLGFTIERETTKELRGSCIIHGGKNKTAFRFNKDRNTWKCFTHKCHDIFGSDVIALIKAVKKVNFMDAVYYLRELVGDVNHNINIALEYERKKDRRAFIESTITTNEAKPTIVNEDCLDRYKMFRSDSFIKDGFSENTLDYFEVAGGYTDGFGYIRDIIPIRNDKGVLVAYSMRDIRRGVEDDDYKYILTKGFVKDKVLYNLNHARYYIPNNKPSLILVEGFKSVWRLHDLGIKNVVAVMGSELTYGQAMLLFSYATSGVVVFFDGDTPGILGAIKTCEFLKGRLPCFPIFITDEGKDPSDLDDNTIYNYLRGYV